MALYRSALRTGMALIQLPHSVWVPTSPCPHLRMTPPLCLHLTRNPRRHLISFLSNKSETSWLVLEVFFRGTTASTSAGTMSVYVAIRSEPDLEPQIRCSILSTPPSSRQIYLIAPWFYLHSFTRAHASMICMCNLFFWFHICGFIPTYRRRQRSMCGLHRDGRQGRRRRLR